MKKTVLILIFLISNPIFCQNGKAELQMEMETKTEFRKLTGKLTLEDGQPYPSQNVIIRGTTIGTITDFDGKFCLIIPKNKTVFIEVPFCFDHIFREIEPTDETIELQIGRGKRKTKKSLRNYEKIKAELNSELYKIYNSEEYKNAGNICG